MASVSELFCHDDRARRKAVRGAPLNGIDYVELGESQRRLRVFFLGKAPAELAADNVQIEGGERIRDIRVVSIDIERRDEGLDDCLHVTVDRAGDFSTYRLCIVALDDKGRPTRKPPADFDPRYACCDFSFKAECPGDLDCASPPICPEPPRPRPDINYLAKDYASFRQLILDRLSVIMPEWRDRLVPDVGYTLVELLAYVGDYLSYYQDAVATEAYLATARRRISVRRHVRFVDYTLHEGCSARAWVALGVSQDIVLSPRDFYLVTGGSEDEPRMLKHEDLKRIGPADPLLFEPIAGASSELRLRKDRSEIRFHTWLGKECCLPRGATSATLVDPGSGEEKRRHVLDLRVCDVLIFEEKLGPKTGNPDDADRTHRHAVRLTSVRQSVDAVPDPATGRATLLWEVQWGERDALPFPLCLSSITSAPECKLITDVSVALGNVIPVDHGETQEADLDPVPEREPHDECGDECEPAEHRTRPGLFRPMLATADVTFCAPLAPCELPPDRCEPGKRFTPAADFAQQLPYEAVPQIRLTDSAETWESRQDLLESGSDDRHFVVEIDDERRAYLRFGDGRCGRMPDAGTQFHVRWRVGNGAIGNIGAEAVRRIVFRRNYPDGVEITPRNPLPATGGTAPESTAEAKLRAPYVFRRRMERAVTAADYATIAVRDFADQVQRAGAALRWDGSGAVVWVAIDALRSGQPDPVLLCRIEQHLQGFRRIGHEVHVVPARAIPLRVELKICVKPGYLRGHVKAAVLDVLGRHTLSDGRRGFFHPDELALGDPIYASRLVALAQAQAGVDSVQLIRFERLYEGPQGEIEKGVIPIGPLDVARLDNDPSKPENGVLSLRMEGGR